MPNNTTHRAATIQRIRIGTTKDGKITAIAHDTVSGDLPAAGPRPRRCPPQLRGSARALPRNLAAVTP
jgi:CO/xanthine dehydrogenase Mo-binding subunit